MLQRRRKSLLEWFAGGVRRRERHRRVVWRRLPLARGLLVDGDC